MQSTISKKKADHRTNKHQPQRRICTDRMWNARINNVYSEGMHPSVQPLIDMYNSGKFKLAPPIGGFIPPERRTHAKYYAVNFDDFLNRPHIPELEECYPKPTVAAAIGLSLPDHPTSGANALPQFDHTHVDKKDREEYQVICQTWIAWMFHGGKRRDEPLPEASKQLSDNTKGWILESVFTHRILQNLREELADKTSAESLKKLVELMRTRAETEAQKLGNGLLKRISEVGIEAENEANKQVNVLMEAWMEEMPATITELERDMEERATTRDNLPSGDHLTPEVDNLQLNSVNHGSSNSAIPLSSPQPNIKEQARCAEAAADFVEPEVTESGHSSLEICSQSLPLPPVSVPNNKGRPYDSSLMPQEEFDSLVDSFYLDGNTTLSSEEHQTEAREIFIQGSEQGPALLVRGVFNPGIEQQSNSVYYPVAKRAKLNTEEPTTVQIFPDTSSLGEQESTTPDAEIEEPKTLEAAVVLFDLVEQESKTPDSGTGVHFNDSPQLEHYTRSTITVKSQVENDVSMDLSSPSKQLVDDLNGDITNDSLASVSSSNAATESGPAESRQLENKVSLDTADAHVIANDEDGSLITTTPQKAINGAEARPVPSSPRKTLGKNPMVKQKLTKNVFVIVESRGLASPTPGSAWSWGNTASTGNRAIQPAVTFSMNKPGMKNALFSNIKDSETETRNTDPVEKPNPQPRQSLPLKSTFQHYQRHPQGPQTFNPWANGANFAVLIPCPRLESQTSMPASHNYRPDSHNSGFSTYPQNTRDAGFGFQQHQSSNPINRAMGSEFESGSTASLPFQSNKRGPPNPESRERQNHPDHAHIGSYHPSQFSSRDRFASTGKGPRGFSKTTTTTRPPRMNVDITLNDMSTTSNRYLHTDSPRLSASHAARTQTPTPVRTYGRRGSISPTDNLRNALPQRPTNSLAASSDNGLGDYTVRLDLPASSRRATREAVTAQFKNATLRIAASKKFADAVKANSAFKGLVSEAEFDNDATTLRITGPAGSNLRGLLKDLFPGVALRASMG